MCFISVAKHQNYWGDMKWGLQYSSPYSLGWPFLTALASERTTHHPHYQMVALHVAYSSLSQMEFLQRLLGVRWARRNFCHPLSCHWNQFSFYPSARGRLFSLTTHARSVLLDHHTCGQWAIHEIIFNRGSLIPEHYFKGSSTIKRLKKAGLKPAFCPAKWKTINDGISSNQCTWFILRNRLAYKHTV